MRKPVSASYHFSLSHQTLRKEMGMKVKLTVLTLLVVGLLMGMSVSAFAEVSISKGAFSIADDDFELTETGIPATMLTLTNDSTAVVTVDQLGQNS